MTTLTFCIIFLVSSPAISGGPPLVVEDSRIYAAFSSKEACDLHAEKLMEPARKRLPPGRKLAHKCVQQGELT